MLSILFGFSALMGLGIFEFLFGNPIENFVVRLLCYPGIGLGLVALVSAWGFHLGFGIDRVWPIPIFIGTLTSGSYLFCRRSKPILTRRRIIEGGIGVALFAVLAGILLSSVWATGSLTTPWRTGVDQVGYSETANYLSNGGTYEHAMHEFRTSTGASDFRQALEFDGRMADASIAVHTNFLFVSTRVGFPAVVAYWTRLLKLDHSYRLAFLLLIFPTVLLGALAYFFLRELEFSQFHSTLWATALVFNCNLINVWYEGQYAHTFSAPFGLAFWVLFYWVRSGRIGGWRVGAAGAFCVAVQLCVYQELSKANFILICGLLIWDLVTRQPQFMRSLKFVAASHALAALAVFPQTRLVLDAALFQLKAFKTSGWQQPQWANPVEILGLVDIYRNNPPSAYTYLGRNTWEFWLGAAISAVIILAVVYAIVRKRIVAPMFWLLPGLFIVFIFAKNFFLEKIINYQYMKSYTIMLPLLLILFAQAINSIRWRDILVPILATAMVWNGFSYVDKFRRESYTVSEAMFSLVKLGPKLSLDQMGLITVGQVAREHMILPLFRMYWLNWGFRGGLVGKGIVAPLLTAEFNPNVILVIPKMGMKCQACLTKFKKVIFFENEAFAFLRTPFSAVDFVTSDLRRFDRMQSTIETLYGELR